METIESLKWRYAVKKFNTNSVSTADLNQILGRIKKKYYFHF
ncbi:hypothetical protein HDE70_000228 [Pedobacter cryoconitis]|nr:hypothetical protein [Pedobacter cryoconitis]